MPKYTIKNENVLNEFLDKFWKNIGRRKGTKFIQNLFKSDPQIKKWAKEAEELQDKIVSKLQGSDKPDYHKLSKDLDKI